MNKGGVWYAQLTVDFEDGGSGPKPFRLDGCTSEADATARTKRLAKAAVGKKFPRTGAAKLEPEAITFGDYFALWCEARKASGLKTWGKDQQRITKFALDTLRDCRMTALEADPQPIRDVVEALDKRAQLARTDAAIKFSESTACKVWEALTTLFATASGSNDRKLRVLKTNPTKGIKGPKRALRAKEKQWLFPREFARLVECTDAPLGWRQAYAVATCLFLRVAELRALQCEDIDLDAGMVRVHRGTKKDSVRHFRLEPAIVPLLRHLMERVGGKGRLFRLPVERHIAKGRAPQAEMIGQGKQARRLRDHLWAAGVRREALHTSTRQAVQITFHDLRATGITWLAIRGDSMISIRDRAGHTDVDQTDAYVRRASLAGAVGEPFPSLAALYPSAGPSIHSARDSARASSDSGVSLGSTGTYGVEPRGIESLSGAPTTEKTEDFDLEPCPNCRRKPAPRRIPRDISGTERRGPTVQEQASAWALAYAFEGLLARSSHALGARPRNPGQPLETVTTPLVVKPKRGRNAG